MSDNELSWDEKANAKANVQWYNPDHGDGDCRKCQINFQVREGFEMGAKWQREQIRECFKNHPVPRCEEHPDGDPISCGWKSAYISLLDYLEES